MSVHPIELSTRIIDSGVVDTPPNRVTQELSELADGVALIESFSHVLVVDTGDGLVAFDSSGAHTGRAVVESLRGLVGRAGPHDRLHPWPRRSRRWVTGVRRRRRGPRRADPASRSATSGSTTRFDRYEYTAGYNRVINMRQFGGAAVGGSDRPRHAVPAGGNAATRRDVRRRI